MANSLGRTVPLTVILPTDKVALPGMPQREAGKPYKTLYLLHGMIGSCNDWLFGTRIQRWAEERELAVVMPSGENAMYLDNPVDKYGEYVGKELVDFTRRTFPLSHKREETFIGGLSMGGFGAMRNGLKYRDTFGAIISLSGAFIVDEHLLEPEEEQPKFPSETMAYRHWFFGKDLEESIRSDKNPEYLLETLGKAGEKLPAIYMAIGRDDFLLQQNLRVKALLEKYAIPHVFELGNGAHEWDFWDTYLKRALDWLPLEELNQGRSSGNVALD